MQVTLGKGQNGFNLSQFGFASLLSGGGYANNPFGHFDDFMNTTYMTRIRNDGARTMRLSVDAAPFAANPGLTGTYLSPVFDALAKLINFGQFKVILDFHAQGNSKVPGYTAKEILDSPVKFGNLIEAEKQAASNLKLFYPNSPVILSLFNEVPETRPTWPTELDQLYTAVRGAGGIDLTLMISGDNWANASGLNKVDPTKFDSNVLFDIHSYIWQPITHQGAPTLALGPDSCIPYLTRIKWPRDATQKAAVIAAAKANIDAHIWGSINNAAALKSQVDDYMTIWFDNQYGDLSIDYDAADAWVAQYGIAANRIHWGEIGVWGDIDTYLGMDLQSRVNYLKAHRDNCDARGYSFTVWDLNNPNTAWRTNSAIGAEDIDPLIKAALFGGLGAPGPVTLTRGDYLLPGGTTIKVP